MNRPFWLGLLALAGVAGLRAETTRVIAVGPNPESVTRGFGGHYYVSLMGETRTPGDGNGRIVKVADDQVSVFADGLDDPKGLVFTGDFLVTADFTKLWKIDAAGRKTLLAAPEAFPQPPVYLNDVALAPDGRSVLVTDMGAAAKMRGPDGKLWPLDSAEARALPAIGRVYRVALADGKVSEVVAPDARMACPNGVEARPGGAVVVAEFFKGNVFRWEAGQWTLLAEGHRSVDGIAHDAAGNFYVSEVMTGKVWRYPVGGGKGKLLTTLESAADILLDAPSGVLAIPNTKVGTLVLVPLGHE